MILSYLQSDVSIYGFALDEKSMFFLHVKTETNEMRYIMRFENGNCGRLQ